MRTPGKEGRHRPGSDPRWGESWYLDFATADGSLGGYVRLDLYPNRRACWYWAYLVGENRPLIAVRDHDVAPPRGAELEVRSEGLWSALTCETPFDHWSVGLEAFAVALDPPADAYHGERGDRIALGFDLEWEATAPAFDYHPTYRSTERYEQSGIVHGEILVGRERLAFDGSGQRDHSWGVREWWSFPWCWTAGRLSDNSVFHGIQAGWPGTTFETGYLASGSDLKAVETVAVQTEIGAEGLPESGVIEIGQLALDVTSLEHAPIRLESPEGRLSRLPRALCGFTTADGRTGTGWTEWLQPAEPSATTGGFDASRPG